MESLETIRNRCDILLAAAKTSNNEERVELLTRVKEFLKNDNCFVGAYKYRYYLLALGYDFDQINEVYDYYNDIKVFLGLLEYTDKNGNVCQKEAMLCPSVEIYYIFDNGIIFKLNKNNHMFYSLVDGNWVYDVDVERMFYDAQYNYKPIKYSMIENDISKKKR